MMNNILKITSVFTLIIFVAFFSVGIIKISSGYNDQISVTGTARKDVTNQIAEFTVTFTSENKDKGNAESDNNRKVKKFLEDIKTFGIPESDVTTDSLNVYQKQEETWSESEGRNKWNLTDWVFSQSIRVKIKDVSKVNEFTNIASRNETSNIYGPNFTIDTLNINETEVYNLAFENAKKKAEALASQSGRTLGKAMYITEGSNNSPLFPVMARGFGGGGGGASAELPIGSSEVSKTLNVVFELR
jgi:uncharacterized protein YggE